MARFLQLVIVPQRPMHPLLKPRTNKVHTLARCFHQMAKKDNLIANMGRLEAAYANSTSSEEKQKLQEEMNT
jgi:predicted amidophosphoribosyltransferase